MGATEKEQGVPGAGLVMMCRGRDWGEGARESVRGGAQAVGRTYTDWDMRFPNRLFSFVFVLRDGLEEDEQDQIGMGRGGSLCQVLLPLGAVGSRHRNPDQGGSH